MFTNQWTLMHKSKTATGRAFNGSGKPIDKGHLGHNHDPSMHPSIDFVRWFEIIYTNPQTPEISQMIFRYKQNQTKFHENSHDLNPVPSATRKMKRPTVLAEEFLDINGAPLNPKLHGSSFSDSDVNVLTGKFLPKQRNGNLWFPNTLTKKLPLAVSWLYLKCCISWFFGF